MSEIDGALLLLSLITCGVTGVFAMTVVMRDEPLKPGREPYVPLNQRGVTPLSKGREPYTNQTAPTVPPPGPAGASSPAAPASGLKHLHTFEQAAGRRVAVCACGASVWTSR